MANVPTPNAIRQRLQAAGVSTPVTKMDLTREIVNVQQQIEKAVDAAVTRCVEQQIGRKLSASEMRARMDVLLAKYNFNPIEELIKTAQDPDTPLAERTKIQLQLTEYLLPKLKSVEVQGEVQHAHTIVIERYGADGTVTREDVRGPAAPIRAAGEKVVDVVVEKS